MSDRADTLAHICAALSRDDRAAAREVARREYPFEPHTNAGRGYSLMDSMRVFVRDGFTDRYTGTRLVHPAALKILSRVIPDEFPFHKNGKLTECHMAYWELFPTVDHVKPVARGGADDESNWVCTSMLRNAIKAQWTLEELGWSLLPAPTAGTWDGLVSWSKSFLAMHPEHLADKYVARWHRAAVKATVPSPAVTSS